MIKKGIFLPNGNELSRIIISTALGILGNGIFPHTLRPNYQSLLREADRTNTSRIGKSFTFNKRVGNFRLKHPWTWKYIQNIGVDGMLNAYGLTNPGLEKVSVDINLTGHKVVPSFFPEFSNGIERAIRETVGAILLLDQAFSIIEFNYSCPNMKKEIITENVASIIAHAKAIRELFPNLMIIAKISYVHPYELSEELERIGINVIHAINTIPYALVFPEGKSPLANVSGGGGVSGGPSRDLAMRYNRGLRKKISIPIIMGCGVCNMTDVRRYEDMGANAVSICTIALRNPQLTATILRKHNYT